MRIRIICDHSKTVDACNNLFSHIIMVSYQILFVCRLLLAVNQNIVYADILIFVNSSATSNK